MWAVADRMGKMSQSRCPAQGNSEWASCPHASNSAASCRNPTVLLRAIPRRSGHPVIPAGGSVAIPPCISGQLRGFLSSLALLGSNLAADILLHTRQSSRAPKLTPSSNKVPTAMDTTGSSHGLRHWKRTTGWRRTWPRLRVQTGTLTSGLSDIHCGRCVGLQGRGISPQDRVLRNRHFSQQRGDSFWSQG